MEPRELEQKMELLRQEMIATAERQGSLVDASVVALSQQLDQLVVQLQRMKMNNYARLT